MKKIIIISFLLQIVFSVYCYSQFNGYYGKINKKPAYDGQGTILALGEQNDDGYDDFVICSGNYSFNIPYVFSFYRGGPVIDTLPYFEFTLPFTTYMGIGTILTTDINNDGYNDLLVSMVPNGGAARILVYYCGTILDSIPDQIMNLPDGASYNYGFTTTLIKDFDGDGNEELACYDPFTRYSGDQHWGTIYFHKIHEGIIDTIPFKIIEGNPDTKKAINKIESIDLNKDGYQDLVIWGINYINISFGEFDSFFINIYLGNADWDITTYSQEIIARTSEELDNLMAYVFLPDITINGKTDLITSFNGNPNYHKAALLNGGFPIDTTIRITLNTSNKSKTNEVAENLDANGDGVPDLLVKMFGLGTHDTYLWLGSSNFQQYPTKKWIAVEGYEGAKSGNIGDVNGDGADDIYIGQTDNNNTINYPGKVQIFLGDTSVHVPITSINDDAEEKPAKYELLNAYPNPFNPETVISYQLLVNSFVTLKVYDLLGKEVAELVNDEQRPGKYKVNFSGKNLASGVYIVQYSYIQGDGLNVIKSLKIELVK